VCFSSNDSTGNVIGQVNEQDSKLVILLGIIIFFLVLAPLSQIVHVINAYHRWPMSLGMTMNDVSVNNAYSAFMLDNPTWNIKDAMRRKKFMLELGYSLCKPHATARALNCSPRLHLSVRLAMKNFLKLPQLPRGKQVR
jgi:hypothetical protein